MRALLVTPCLCKRFAAEVPNARGLCVQELADAREQNNATVVATRDAVTAKTLLHPMKNLMKRTPSGGLTSGLTKNGGLLVGFGVCLRFRWLWCDLDGFKFVFVVVAGVSSWGAPGRQMVP